MAKSQILCDSEKLLMLLKEEIFTERKAVLKWLILLIYFAYLFPFNFNKWASGMIFKILMIRFAVQLSGRSFFEGG